MKMKRMFVILAAVVTAGSLAWVTGAAAQTQAPAQSAPAAPAAMEKQLEGQIKSLDPSGKKLTLADGTELMIPETVKITKAELKPGAMVKVAYEEKGGQKIVKQLEVRQ